MEDFNCVKLCFVKKKTAEYKISAVLSNQKRR
jgi:hypothetical protein